MMLTFINPFVEQAAPSVVCLLRSIVPELSMFTVFLLSYGLFRHIKARAKDDRTARKLKVDEASPPQVTKTASQCASAPSRAARPRALEALESQMLQHLEQHEFTRALTLYRSAKPDAHEHFSEDFYTAFIESAVRVGKMDIVERLFGAVKRSSLKPSEDFWQRTLKMLAARKHFSTCLLVHSVFKQQLPADKVVWSCLTNAALEVGDTRLAATMLEQFAKANISIKDHILFFRVYLALKDADSAEAMFHKLGSQTSSLMLNHLLLTCVTSGQAERALRLLHEAHDLENTPALVDIVSYNTVMKGLAQASTVSACFECLRELISKGLQPDNITFAALVDACIEGNAVEMIGEILNLASEGKNQVGMVVYNLFIKGLVKANCLPRALELCEEMQQRAGARPDLATYSVLIKGLVDQHDLARAVDLVEGMKSAGLAPDDFIITHLLEGCRFAGNYEFGKKLFGEMLANGVKPSEFTLVTMLKLCGRAGEHQEAHDLVAGWEAAYGQKPSVIHYTCLMSGCLCKRRYDLAWAAYDLMTTNGVKPDGCTLSTLLPGMMAAGSWDRVLLLAKEALAGPWQHKIPPETLNRALAQLQAAEGYARQAEELRGLMHAAGIPVAPQRPRPQRPHLGRN